MRFLLLFGFIAINYFSTSYGSDLIVGSSFNARLASQQKIEYIGYPFKKRVKEAFYSDPGQQLIKGIIARETEHTDGSAIVTAGGIGYSYVNIRFKSERSYGIYYMLEIYT